MADKIPVKARYSGSDVISLGELEAGVLQISEELKLKAEHLHKEE